MPVMRPRSLRPMLVAMLLASASLRAQGVGAASPSVASDEIRVGVNRGWTDYRYRHLGPELKEMKNLQYRPSGLEVHVTGNSAWVLFRYSLKADVNGRAADVVGLGTATLERRGTGWVMRHMHTSGRARRATDPA